VKESKSLPGHEAGAASSGSLAPFLLRGGGATLSARLIAVGAGLAVQMLLARLLEPAGVGAFFLTQSVVALVALVAQLGLPRMVVREVARALGSGRPGLARGTVRASVKIAAVGVGGAALVYAFVLGPWLAESVFESPLMAATSSVAAVWVVAIACQSLGGEVLRGARHVGAASVFGGAGALGSAMTAAILGAILIGRGSSTLSEVILVSVGSALTSFLLASVVIRWRLGGVTEQVAARTLLAGTTAMLISNISHTGAAQSDLWIVGAMLTDTDVAVYGAAKRLMRLVSLPMVIVSLVVPPVIADLHHRGQHERLERIIRGVSTLAGLPSLGILAVFLLSSELVLGLVYGPFYASGAFILAVLSVERILFVWAGPAGMTLMMTGHERRMMVVTLLTGMLEVVAIVIGTYLGGGRGAALGFLVGSGLRSVATWNEARRAVGLRTDVNFFDLRESSMPLRRLFRVGRDERRR